MNAGHVAGRWLADHRKPLLVWALGAAIPALLYLSFWNSMKDGILDKLDMLPESLTIAMGLQDLTSAAGYTQSTVFQLLGLLIVIIFAITQGARSIGGDEESGALELTLAHATNRRSVGMARVGAITFMIVLAAAALGAGVTIMNSAQQLGLSLGNVWSTTLALLLLVLLHGYVAFTVGAATGRRGLAIGVASGTAVLGYLVNNLGSYIADWVPRLSPFYWAYHGEPLTNGVQWPLLALLAGVSVLVIFVGLVAFDRRDIRN